MAGHAVGHAHLLRELTAVTETGTGDDVIWARQAIGALLDLEQAPAAARTAVRSYRAAAARHGIGWPGALTRAAAGHPWIPGTT